ncbi:MAG TPA: GTPase, partial [Terriglobales bacterium]|nr:GTPase [Terriglobales bacterium]
DIPGLIEGASSGQGLGTQFLRHIERTRLLLHLVDVSDASGRSDPTKDFKVIMNELESWGTGLEQKPMMLLASKIDVANPEKLAKLKRLASRHKLPFMAISAVTGEGIEKLKYTVGKKVGEIRAEAASTKPSDAHSLPA